MAKTIIPQLKDKGKVTRGWLGVQTQPVTPELAKQFGIEGDKGALISDVIKDTPAERAGIKSGDIILEFDGKPVREANELTRIVASTPPDKKIKVRVFRDGKEQTLDATLEQRKDDGDSTPEGVTADKLGLGVRDLTRELAASLRLKETKGVVVVEVKPGGPADDVILRGDLILSVNNQKVETVQEYEKVLAGLQKGNILFLVRRGDSKMFALIKVD
jgi:serine protease Do